MDIPIIYEDADVVVIDKPSGVFVHRDRSSKEETIADWFLARNPETAQVGESLRLQDGTLIERPGVVHRLDRETSGVVVLAKTQEAFLHLKKQFQERSIEKVYRAFVHGEMKEARGIIDRPIGKSAKDFRLRSAQRGARGTLRDAITHWEALAIGKGFSCLALFPKTGRTHQLRVHLKAINHPIVCDLLYAQKQGCALGFSCLALHAHRLTLDLPNGERRTFEVPIPEEFLRAQEKIKV